MLNVYDNPLMEILTRGIGSDKIKYQKITHFLEVCFNIWLATANIFVANVSEIIP